MNTVNPDHAAHDRPWKRPGARRYAARRLIGIIHPNVEVYEPVPGSVEIRTDIAAATRDGTTLRVNVYLPPTGGPFPTLLCAHPYGKDRLPKRRRFGGHFLPFQYHMLRQPETARLSTLTAWEAPDPAWWTARGFAVVNCDLRGAGHSPGVGAMFSDQEGQDVYDLVEWAAAQSWSTGAIGMVGVSYLAISQWKAAAAKPPHLKAIVPWEGMTDPYRDLMRPGGIREIGFVKIWSRGTRTVRLKYRMDEQNSRHPLRDEFWRSLVARLADIEVPALICGSFSDNNLHSRGSVRAYEQISSPDKHLYTHRGGKWATFYSEGTLNAQLSFFDRHLRGGTGEPLPRVRLEVRECRDRIAQVRGEATWPPPSTRWTPLYLSEAGLGADSPERSGSITFDTHKTGARFGWTVPRDTELSGPMALRLYVSVDGADDVDLFVGVEKCCGSTYIPFEGSYGFGRDRVTTGWLRASLRALDAEQSRPFDPVPTFATPEPLLPGRPVPVDIALGPSATLFRAGEQVRLVVAGRWLWPRNPLSGQFPAAYEKRPRARCTLHWGPEQQANLLVPVIGGRR